jgi:hypothetical protein
MEALVDAAVHLGFSRRVAEALGLQTVEGSALFARKSGRHLAELRNMVTSPGGTSAAAIRASAVASYLRSGIGFPDFVVWGGAPLDAPGYDLRAAGLFGPDWEAESGERWLAPSWREVPAPEPRRTY